MRWGKLLRGREMCMKASEKTGVSRERKPGEKNVRRCWEHFSEVESHWWFLKKIITRPDESFRKLNLASPFDMHSTHEVCSLYISGVCRWTKQTSMLALLELHFSGHTGVTPPVSKCCCVWKALSVMKRDRWGRGREWLRWLHHAGASELVWCGMWPEC